MKYITLFLALSFSAGASAYNYEEQDLSKICSHASSVSQSSVFGSQSLYSTKYPDLGWLSAKIDKVSRVKPETRTVINEILLEAKRNKDAVQYDIYKNGRMIERTKDSITLSQQTASMSSHVYNQVTRQLYKENIYVTEKALKDVFNALKSDQETYGKAGQYMRSSYLEYQRCEEWWGFR
jgi:hypothetical protein